MDTHGLSRAPVIFVVHDMIANRSVLSKLNLPLHARTIDRREPSSLVVTDLPRFTYKDCFDPDHVFRIRGNHQLKMLQKQLWRARLKWRCTVRIISTLQLTSARPVSSLAGITGLLFRLTIWSCAIRKP